MRAGPTTKYSFGDDEADLGDYAWYDANTKEAAEVGLKKTNPWGLYDVHGNVWEWCHDWKAEELLSGVDSFGPDEGRMHVFRGGSWALSAWSSRSAQRDGGAPIVTVGFRVVLSPIFKQNDQLENRSSGK